MELIGLGGRLLAPLRRGREMAAAMAARVTPEPGQEVPAFLRRPDAGGGALLECRGVSKRFGEFTAVDGVDLTLLDRRLHALIGPNGAGKTTLFNVVSGMYPPDGGQLLLEGKHLEGLPPERVAAHGLARSFQITNLFPALTVLENLRLGAQARDPRRFDAWKPRRPGGPPGRGLAVARGRVERFSSRHLPPLLSVRSLSRRAAKASLESSLWGKSVREDGDLRGASAPPSVTSLGLG